MLYKTYDSVNNNFKPETTVWATAFEEARTKEALTSYCKPTKGILVCGKSLKEHENEISDAYKYSTNATITHFVPFKKDGTPAWSKAVSIDSRVIADTEDEAKTFYNNAIDEAIQTANRQHQERIAKLMECKI